MFTITYYERRYTLGGYYTGNGSYCMVLVVPHQGEVAFPWRVLKQTLATINPQHPRTYSLGVDPPVIRKDLRVFFNDGLGEMDIQIDTGEKVFTYTILQHNRFRGETIYQNLTVAFASINQRLGGIK